MSRFSPLHASAGSTLRRASLLLCTLPTLWLAGCAVEIQNLQPAKELAQRSQPPGVVYTGWRVFQDKCASCHGPAAAGTANGPDLLPRMREMGAKRFVSLVLLRYDLDVAGKPAERGTGADQTLVDAVAERRSGALTMPAWQGEPRVDAHIVDLYAYLSARAEGTQGAGRPTP